MTLIHVTEIILVTVPQSMFQDYNPPNMILIPVTGHESWFEISYMFQDYAPYFSILIHVKESDPY